MEIAMTETDLEAGHPLNPASQTLAKSIDVGNILRTVRNCRRHEMQRSLEQLRQIEGRAKGRPLKSSAAE
jgi:hypothetical protein